MLSSLISQTLNRRYQGPSVSSLGSLFVSGRFKTRVLVHLLFIRSIISLSSSISLEKSEVHSYTQLHYIYKKDLFATMAAKVAVASDPDREQTAGGLRDHFLKNSHHQTSIVNDGYRMPTKFDITTSNAGVYKGPQLHQATADLLNDLLQKNQLSHHVYFSETGGFHNHTCHHLLAAYALGATPEELQFAYDSMEGVQRARLPIDQRRVEEMHTEGGFKSMLGDGDQFQNYLAFFWQKLEKDGWRNALNEYLFSGSEIAEELFVRLYAGKPCNEMLWVAL